ncbi:hypothetical protein KKD37_04575 [Patescibacteria group bacterium]|nr:hypothetical protein [Patescibacteria group bacterium]
MQNKESRKDRTFRKTSSINKRYPHLDLSYAEDGGIKTACAIRSRQNNCIYQRCLIVTMRQSLETNVPTITSITGMSLRSCQECIAMDVAIDNFLDSQI